MSLVGGVTAEIYRVTSPPPGEGVDWSPAMGYAEACFATAEPSSSSCQFDEQKEAVAAITSAGGNVA